MSGETLRSALLAFGIAILTLHPAPGDAAKPAVDRGARLRHVQDLLRDGKYPDAEVAARDLLRDAERQTPVDSTFLATTLDQLAVALRRSGKSSAPESWEIGRRAIRIKEALADGDSTVAFSLQNLGALLLYAGRYDEARPLLERALELRERSLGERHPDVATSLTWIGNLESRTGGLTKAEPLLRRALEIRRTVLPAGDPAVAECANALATVLMNLGDVPEAIPLYEEAIEVNRVRLGERHPALGEAHHNLGATLFEAGDYEEARSHLELALTIRKQALGADHPLLGSTLTVLGSVLEALRQPEAARSRYEEAFRVRRKALGEQNAETAWTMMKLGLLDLDQRRIESAARLLESALRVQKATLGERHYDLAWTLGGLARLAGIRGDIETATDLYRQALEIQDVTYGAAGPEVALTLGAYAAELAHAGRDREAAVPALRGAQLGTEHLRLTAQGLAERQALAYASKGGYGLDVALSLACHDSGAIDLVEVWDALIRTRTLVLDSVIERQRVARIAMSDTSVASASYDLDRARRTLAGLLVAGGGDSQGSAHRSALERARQGVEQAERSLAAVSAGSRKAQERDRIGFAEVASALPPRRCLVSYVRFRSPSGQPEYMAFVLRGSAVRGIPLGSADVIDSLIGRWVSTFTRAATFATRMPPSEEKRCRTEGQRVFERIWVPLIEAISGTERVYVVPDGAVLRVSLAALPVGTADYLVEVGPKLQYLSSERDLLPAPSRAAGHGLLAIGNPTFGKAPSRSTPRSGDCTGLDGVEFGPLPESEQEVREISSVWPARNEALVLTGAAASESTFKADAPGRLALHLATHGFFLDGVCHGGVGVRGIGGTTTTTSPLPSRTTTRRVPPSPLLQLSGLALAGANRRGEQEGEDGILTAQEISSLDLSALHWVVLSACDTGLGRIQAWEGVLGLRRAFQAAGARVTVMSMWSVEDRSTREWMERFYGSLLSDRKDLADAVRDASLGVLREERARRRSTHPFYWAAFVATGGDT